jgi:ubiquinone/menaquinone biosynthesis C-methylase UbiE
MSGTVYSNTLHWLKTFVAPESKVIEIGSGSGQYKQLLDKGNLICTDVPNSYYQSAAQIDVINRGEALPFASSSADILFSQGAVDYIEYLDAHFDEAFRVLKPGGKMLVFTYEKKTLKRIHKESKNIYFGSRKHFHIFNEGQLAQKLKNSGFTVKRLPFALNIKNSILQELVELPGIRNIISRNRSWRTFLAEK